MTEGGGNVLDRTEGASYNMTMKALEATGTMRDDRDIVLDEPLPLKKESRVRVIVLVPEGDDIDERAWMHATASNPAFAFLHDPCENNYSSTDGKPFADQV